MRGARMPIIGGFIGINRVPLCDERTLPGVSDKRSGSTDISREQLREYMQRPILEVTMSIPLLVLLLLAMLRIAGEVVRRAAH